MGRKSKLTPEMADILVRAVAFGLSYKRCCEIAGIAESSFYLWRKLGQQAKRKNKYLEFSERIDVALANTGHDYLNAIRRSVMEPVKIVKKHVKEVGSVKTTEIIEETRPPDIKGALWWLERMVGEEFGRRDAIEHSGEMAVRDRKVTIELVIPGTVKEGESERASRNSLDYQEVIAEDSRDSSARGADQFPARPKSVCNAITDAAAHKARIDQRVR